MFLCIGMGSIQEQFVIKSNDGMRTVNKSWNKKTQYYFFVLITVYCKTNQLKHGWTIMICHFFQLFFSLIFLFFFSLASQSFFFLSVNLLYENQKTHDTINSRELLVGYFLFLFCFKESFCKDWWALFNTLKRVRLGLRALGWAFSGYPAGFYFSGLWAGLHWFFFYF